MLYGMNHTGMKDAHTELKAKSTPHNIAQTQQKGLIAKKGLLSSKKTRFQTIRQHPMKNMQKILLLTVCLLTTLGVHAQDFTITGKVMDNEGFEVIGANISIKGNAGVGTITNIDGQYTLKIQNPSKAILVFSYIGMKTQEVPVKNQKQLNIILMPDNQLLDEVVVIGYGTAKRSDLTGSVVSVKSEDLMQTPTSDVGQALAGRVAGVSITQAEGAPGSGVSIRVRGGISITQSNEPLYVIDGFPSEDGMASLDPGEIESINILKDASSTAIYGARGANGVVVITTKSGGKNDMKMTVKFDSYVGIKKVTKKLNVLSPKEFVLLDYERNLAFKGEDGVKQFQNLYGSFNEIDENYANREGIDWQDEALGRVTTSQNYRVSISGGNKDMKYSLTYSYFKDLGAMIKSGNNKHNVSFNISHKASERFQANARITYNEDKVYGMGTSEGNTRFNKMEHILQYRPIIGLYGNDQDLIWNTDPLQEDDYTNPMQSPLVSASAEQRDRLTRSLQMNGGFTFNFNKRLSFRNSTGMRYSVTRNDVFNGAKSSEGKRSSIGGYVQYDERGSIQTSNVLNYDYRKKMHKLTLMVGQEFISGWNKNLRASATNFPNDDIGLDDMGLGTPNTTTTKVVYDDKLTSFFARANYNLNEKYLLTATVRADGSSKFSDKHKWGYFPSVSAAWRLGEEAFIKKLNLFSDLKVRMGYGLAGNNRVGSYSSLDLLKSTNYINDDSLVPGYVPAGIPSENLKWESNATFNLGVDFGFLEQRITVSPEFYINNSSNLLLNSRVPGSSGFTNMLRNIGKTRNVGVDLTVNSTNIQNKNFTWQTSLNVSYNRNTIKALSGEQSFLEEAAFGYNMATHSIEVGKPLGQFYGHKTIGIYQVDEFDYDATTRTYLLKEGIPYMGSREKVKPGMWKFANLDDSNEVIDDNDRTVIGNANPDFYGGLNNTFKYRNWDMSLFFTFSYGGEVLNATKLTNTKAGKLNYNVLSVVDSNHRWMTIDADGKTVTDPEQLAAMNAGRNIASVYDMENASNYIHSWTVEDASFLRLSNISIGYTFNRKKLKNSGLQGLRLYATGSNLFIWTPYSGFDPEVSTKGNNLTPGVDFGAYPRNRSFVFGVNVTL